MSVTPSGTVRAPLRPLQYMKASFGMTVSPEDSVSLPEKPEQ